MWDVLRDCHSVHTLEDLLAETQEDMKAIVDCLSAPHLRELNKELWKSQEKSSNESESLQRSMITSRLISTI
jgi:hypothetical protein